MPTVPVGERADKRQAIGNLGLNAIQAMPEGGRLTIVTGQASDQVSITLRDTGPGVPEELRERVFEPFFSTKVTGTGLGLPLIREIAVAHGGQLCLDSTPGEGAGFTLSLPIAAGCCGDSPVRSRARGWNPLSTQDEPR